MSKAEGGQMSTARDVQQEPDESRDSRPDLWGPGAEMPLATRQHRLFSYISVNWRGRPLTTYETVVSLIANTTTTTGLVVRCALDPADYPTGIRLSKKQQEDIPFERDDFHGEWNYKFTSRKSDIE